MALIFAEQNRIIQLSYNSCCEFCENFKRLEDVEFEPGTLKTAVYKNGAKIGETEVQTAGTPVKIRLTHENTVFYAVGDLCYVLAEVTDARGAVCPLDMRTIHASVEDGWRLVGISDEFLRGWTF